MENNNVEITCTDIENEMKFKIELNLMRSKLKTHTEIIRDLKTSLNKLEQLYDHDISKTKKIRKQQKNKNTPSGFIKQKPLCQELAELINVPADTLMSLPEYLKKFNIMMKENNMIDTKDKRIFRPNDKIKKLFGLNDNVETAQYNDTNVFSIKNLSKYISYFSKTHGENKKN